MTDAERDPGRQPPTGRDIRRISLAHEAPLRLGALCIEPALRRVVHDDGREEIIEPRVMQVLVALILAGGRILSRDDLLMSCWHGVVVGEDAIDRVIGRLRRLAIGIGDGDFKLETITKVGYRLVSSDRKTEIELSDAPPPLPKATTEPLLAVLAFDNLSEGEDMVWFTDGVSEEILQSVARGADVKVIGRTSSFHYRGVDKVARRISEELGATHLLDGSVRRSGSRVRISAHLIECARETTLWAHRFDRDLSDVFALQDEIASAVASALKTTFAAATPAGKIDPAAYDLYLKARVTTFPELSASVSALERAVTLEPQFAPAWAALALVRALRLREGKVPMFAAARSEAIDAAERALRLDPQAGMAYAALAQLQPRGAYTAREALLDKAMAVAPRDPQTLAQMGWFLPTVGRNEEALAIASQSLSMDRLNYPAGILFAMLLGSMGRYRKCLEAFASFRDQWPVVDVSTPLHYAATLGDWPTFDRLRLSIDEHEAAKPSVAQAIAVGGILRDPSPRRRKGVLKTISEQLASTGTVKFGGLLLACRIGCADETFALIDKASFVHLFDENGPPPAANFTSGIIFDRIANRAMMADSRFVGFCSKIGLCNYWVTTDRWPDCADSGVLPYDFKAEARRLAAAQSADGAEA